MKVECEQSHIEGYLQQLGNYFRVRHYAGIDPNTGKSKFTSHQQSKEYAISQLTSTRKGESLTIKQPIIEHLTNDQESNLKDLSSISSGRSLAWLGHQPPTLTTRVQIPATAFLTALKARSLPYKQARLLVPFHQRLNISVQALLWKIELSGKEKGNACFNGYVKLSVDGFLCLTYV
jgi:hypothetical protein